LLSVEGNDVSTGLKWMLFSNSIVLMPSPTAITWALESHLIPWKHYIPVNHDFSDLKEKLDFCKMSGKRLCEATAAHGKHFMRTFIHEQREQYLQEQILQRYANKVRFWVVDDGLSDQSRAHALCKTKDNVYNVSRCPAHSIWWPGRTC